MIQARTAELVAGEGQDLEPLLRVGIIQNRQLLVVAGGQASFARHVDDERHLRRVAVLGEWHRVALPVLDLVVVCVAGFGTGRWAAIRRSD